MNKNSVFDYPLFAMGFRIFFALAGLSALVLIAIWNAIYQNGLHLDNYYPRSLWHAHEMLLGYASAVIAGFLLTAVKNWSGLAVIKPNQLASLSFLWLYGRILSFYSGLLPDELIAGVDLAFLPTLAYFLSKPLIKTVDLKNLVFIVMLFIMMIANGLMHAEILGYAEHSAGIGITILVAMMVLMIVFIAGRLFPFFTERGLSGVICIRNPILDLSAVLISLAVFLLISIDVTGALLAIMATGAVIIHLLRIAGWYDHRIWYVPLLWVLYLGYGWIILGFAGLALSAYGLVSPLLALHAFTVGGIGITTLSMMARVSLGHTGRVLKASNIMVIAFVIINFSAFARVLIPALLPAWSESVLVLANYAWLAAFSLFLFYYAPILSSARIDGQSG